MVLIRLETFFLYELNIPSASVFVLSSEKNLNINKFYSSRDFILVGWSFRKNASSRQIIRLSIKIAIIRIVQMYEPLQLKTMTGNLKLAANTLSWHTVNASLPGKESHTSNLSNLFWSLKDLGLVLVQTLFCTVLQQLEKNLVSARYWWIAHKNWFQCTLLRCTWNFEFKCSSTMQHKSLLLKVMH